MEMSKHCREESQQESHLLRGNFMWALHQVRVLLAIAMYVLPDLQTKCHISSVVPTLQSAPVQCNKVVASVIGQLTFSQRL